MAPVVVLFDPYHPYATAFIEACNRVWGLRSVCLYTDRRQRVQAAGTHSVVRSGAVAASYWVGLEHVEDVAPELARRHEVSAVIPHAEQYVLPAARLSAALGLPWADPKVVALFRDKACLKQVLRRAGGPRVNASAEVRSPADVIEAMATGDYERFVLKPNSGMGNHAIGFFDSQAPAEVISAYFRTSGVSSVVMEEFLDGPEYCVNGQVDDVGRASTLSVFRTRHVAANGRPQLASSFELVAHRDGRFEELASYASSVLGALGLVRSPFHMEVIVDDRGPCLVEVAARLPGAGQAITTSVAHGGAVDMFVLAAAHHLGRPPGSPQGPDWSSYDSRILRTVCGVSSNDQRIRSLRGTEEVESMPEFVDWVFRPRVGRAVHPTVDLVSSPWLLTLGGPDRAALDRAEEAVRELLVWNVPDRGVRARADALSTLARRAWNRAVGLPELVAVRPLRLTGAGLVGSVAGAGS